MSNQTTFLNHYGLTEDEVEQLEARADFLNDLAEIRAKNRPNDYREAGGFDATKPGPNIIQKDTEAR